MSIWNQAGVPEAIFTEDISTVTCLTPWKDKLIATSYYNASITIWKDLEYKHILGKV
jgi:hypothetical protein